MYEQAEAQRHTTDQEEPDGFVSLVASRIAGTIFRPGETMPAIVQRHEVVPALAVVMLVAIIPAISQVALLLVQRMGYMDAPAGSTVPGFDQWIVMFEFWGIVSSVFWAPVIWVIVAGILYGASMLLGGSGQFMGLWAATGLALVPQLVTSPIAPMLQLASMLGGGMYAITLIIVLPVQILAFIWTLGLYVIGIQTAMNVTTARAIGILALAILGVILVVVLMLCVLIVFFMLVAAALSA